jgi:hypothetical protein
MLKFLAHLFEACTVYGRVPRTWKRSRTVFLYKKGDKDQPENWRPITIVDAAIQGAYEQWREFGKRMAHTKEIRPLHPEETRFVRVDQEDDLAKLGAEILDDCPEIAVDVEVADSER